jgi:hypothetical protein
MLISLHLGNLPYLDKTLSSIGSPVYAHHLLGQRRPTEGGSAVVAIDEGD